MKPDRIAARCGIVLSAVATLAVVGFACQAHAAPLVYRGAVYRGTLADRPRASDAGPAALYVVTDCTTNVCTAGKATMQCVFQNTGTVWSLISCGTTTTTTTTTTVTTTTVTTTTAAPTTTTAASTTTTTAAPTTTTTL